MGDIHLINFDAEPLETALEMEIDTIPESPDDTRLQPMSFTYLPLELPPGQESEFAMDCHFNVPRSFDIHYVLPHYHNLGNLLRLEVLGGPNDGQAIFETTSAVGEPLGELLDPPVELEEATGIRLTCGYDNTTEDWVYYGADSLNANEEMCVFLAYGDGNAKIAGVANEGTNEYLGDDEAGVALNEAECFVVPIESP